MTQPNPHGRTIAQELKLIRKAIARITKSTDDAKAKALRELRSHVIEVAQDY